MHENTYKIDVASCKFRQKSQRLVSKHGPSTGSPTPPLSPFSVYSRLPISRTLANSNQFSPVSLQVIFYIIFPSITRTPDNSKLIQFPLKVRVIGSRLYVELASNQQTVVIFCATCLHGTCCFTASKPDAVN